MTSENRRLRLQESAIRNWRVFAVAVVCAAPAFVAAQGTSRSSATTEKPNVAISGCLMRQGYATLVLGDAHVDAVGATADRAQPGAENGLKDVKVPAKWVLENAGAITQHVGEKVQVLGRTEWTAGKERPADDDAAAAAAPHVDVTSVKVIASTCS